MLAAIRTIALKTLEREKKKRTQQASATKQTMKAVV
jgi:hypothetical protein